ncbi:MAG TPA: PAS domain S-box protein, partial [Myxococcota bacterium]|nr:PAS domain S-box protein [Myxococcota bacterium]
LAVMQEAYGYADVMLAAPDGRVLVSLEGTATLEPEALALVATAAAHRDPVFGEIFRSTGGAPRLDVAARIPDTDGGTLAVLLLRADPQRELYPLLAAWPTQSASAETLLLRRDGDMVVFLHRLRHLEGDPLTIRKTAAKTQYVGARAAQGSRGVVEGIDYRQVPVLADLRAIPGSAWILVSKVDRDEVLAEARYRQAVIVGATVAGIVLAAILFAALAMLRRQRAYAELYRAERERREALEESRVATAALAASERRLKLFLESVGEGIHVLDADGRIAFENPAAVAMFGWSAGEMLGRDAHALVHHHDAQGREYPQGDCPILATLRDGQVRHVEDEVFFRKDARAFPVEYTCAPVHDDSGAITGTVVSFRDVSRRRSAEEGLRRTQEELRSHAALLANAQRIGGMGSWNYDAVGGRLTWSEETCNLFGITPAQFSGTMDHFLGFILPEDLPAYEAAHAKVRSLGGLLEAEYRIRRGDGQVRWMYERGSVEYDDAGNEVRRLGMVMDITERKRLERQQVREATVLAAVSSGEPLASVLEQVALGMEEMIPGGIASILLLEVDGERLRHGAAPNLPAGYVRAIDGQQVGPACGSCGTAMHRKARVIV